MKPFLKFTFQGEPVPAKRPRVTKFGTYTPKEYKDYKSDLIEAIKKDFGFYVWDIPEPGTKERTHYLKNYRYRLDLNIYTSKDSGDYDNYAKSVGDALEQAGIIGNDKQIDEAHIFKAIDKDNPRIEITLNQLKAGGKDERRTHKNQTKG
jgi:Holliday junction resolvase RusA-like endonuclease